MFKAAIFDLDGTICDTITTIAYYGNRALEKFGFKPIEEEKFKYFAGDGAEMLVRRMLSHHGANDEELVRQVHAFYKPDYEKDSLYKTTVFDGIKEVLLKMKAKGMKLGVVSNKPHGAVRDVLNAMFEKDTFDLFTGMTDETVKKPDPTEVLKMIESFKVSPAECIYVGDTDVDMITGKKAGAYTVGVLWGFRDYDELEKNGADKIIKKPEELLDII